MKRFRINDPSGRTRNTRHETLASVVEDLLSDKRDLSLQTYYVECVVDDIEIEAEELLDAFKRGERPEDLQFF
jgi:hypothetical protein